MTANSTRDTGARPLPPLRNTPALCMSGAVCRGRERFRMDLPYPWLVVDRTEKSRLRRDKMRHWVFLLCVCLASVSTAQTQESDSRITPDQAAALNDVLEMDLLRQSTAEGFLAYRSLVCAPEPSYLAEPYLYNRTIDAGVQNELLKRTVAYGGEYAERLRPGSEAVGQDFYTLTAVTLVTELDSTGYC